MVMIYYIGCIYSWLNVESQSLVITYYILHPIKIQIQTTNILKNLQVLSIVV